MRSHLVLILVTFALFFLFVPVQGIGADPEVATGIPAGPVFEDGFEDFVGCGDGLVLGGETCDDGNRFDGDGCNASCNVENGFECSGQPSVCATVCGDGVPAGAETCDDFNLNGGDGCDANCQIESGFQCSGQPSVCELLP